MIYLRVPLFATIPSGMSVPTLVQMKNPAHQPGASHTTCIFIHWSGCSANDDDLHTASNPVPLRIRPDRDLWLLWVRRHSWRKNLCHNLAKDDLVKIMMITRYVVKVVTTWWLLGDHLVTTWWPLGDHLVTTWWLLGDYLVTTWWPLGDHLTTTIRGATFICDAVLASKVFCFLVILHLLQKSTSDWKHIYSGSPF